MPFQDQNLTPIKPTDLNLTPIGSNDLFMQAATPNTEEEVPWYSSLWNSASAPLTDIFSRTSKRVSDLMRFGDDYSFGAELPSEFDRSGQLVNFGGEIADSLSSPINLALAASTGGTSLAARSGMNATAKGLNMATKALSVPVAAHGAINVVHPDSTLGERLTGGLELVGGTLGMKSKVPSVVNKFDDIIPPVGQVADDLPLNGKWDVDETGNPFHVVDESAPNVNRVADDVNLTPIKEADLVAPKPSIIKLKKPTEEMIAKAEANGYILSGVDDQNRVIMTLNSAPDNTPVSSASSISEPIKAELPKDLKGAKPRFNIGTNQYTPEFESDLDKALFIISQKNPSKRDADYLKFVMDTLGVDEQAAREMGKIVRTRIKNVLKGQKPGNVVIPASDNLTPSPNVGPAKVTANTLKPTLGDDFTRALEASAKSPQQILNEEALAARRAGNNPPNSIAQTVDNGGGNIPPSNNNNPIDTGGNGPDIPPNTPPEQASKLRELYELSRGLMSVDAPFLTSAAFRQAAPLVGTKNWFKAWAAATKSFGSQKVFDDVIAKIESRPLFRKQIDGKGGLTKSYAEEVGLRMASLKKLNEREEAIRSQWAEMIPGYGRYVRASNRAYTAFLDSLRADQLETLVGQAKLNGLDPEANLVLGKQIAEVINDATGRSSLKQSIPFTGGKEVSLEKNAKLLTDALWSPRLLNRKLRMLNPANYANVDPFVRQEMIKNLMRSGGNWLAFTGALSLAGGKVNFDPSNPDFGKIRFGDTRIDPGAGLLQLIVLGGRIAKGGTTSSTSGKFTPFGKGYKAENEWSTVGNFMGNQLHPTIAIARDFFMRTDDEPFRVTDRVLQNMLPLFTQDLMKVMADDPSIAKMLMSIGAGSIGLGTQTYDKGSFGKPVYVPSEWDLAIGRN